MRSFLSLRRLVLAMIPSKPGNDTPASNDALQVVGQEKRNGLQRISQGAPPVTHDSMTPLPAVFKTSQALQSRATDGLPMVLRLMAGQRAASGT